MTAPRLYAVPDDDAVSLIKDAGAVELEAEAPPVLPAWVRSREQMLDGAMFAARWYARQWGYHGVRTPLYLGRLSQGRVQLGDLSDAYPNRRGGGVRRYAEVSAWQDPATTLAGFPAPETPRV